MRRNRRTRRFMSQINVVPYIDVMLVLLVIFMITAPLMTQGIHVNLPNAKAKVIPLKQHVPIVVSVDRVGHFYVNVSPTPTTPISAENLVNLVAAELAVDREQNTPRPVFVKGDQSVSYGKVVEAMALLQKAGAPSVGLLTRTPDDVPST
ncbi:MAG: protein TolR [Gammaproteobacteria bacterium CG11_big_fil_rev_8_21_14_0_20_46_22]|nr:MAG: protein TolR [Gammaproteobacteria bacterium CG12_big_fil_rev_8_21_14_0_65_46_12]PIR11916.1 MAG: protein TolR [Gammaproteobacteria bacterium CG11_big_fil_rev_8_21_14_0_20_46_22]